MDWSLVNDWSTVVTGVSLIVFILSSYKTMRTIRAAHALTRHLYLVRGNLCRSIIHLRQEHAILRDEIKNLEQHLAQSSTVRNEMNHTIAHMTQIQDQLQQEIIRANSATMRSHAKTHGATNRPCNTNNKNLPVFVRRRAEKSSHPIF